MFLAALLLGAACIEDDPQPDQVCTHACQCVEDVPSGERECTTTCLQLEIPAECASCLGAASCQQLRDGDCNDLCTGDIE
jgi:hypothetical protein